jgi:hypothetical protein
MLFSIRIWILVSIQFVLLTLIHFALTPGSHLCPTGINEQPIRIGRSKFAPFPFFKGGLWNGAHIRQISASANFTDGNSHKFALYAVDWDRKGGFETIQVVDATTDAVLAEKTQDLIRHHSSHHKSISSAGVLSSA